MAADAASPGSDLDFAETLWKSADALRGQVDAAEYKHVVLGLLFLIESRRLAKLRDYLLPKLISGTVRVDSAESPVRGAGV